MRPHRPHAAAAASAATASAAAAKLGLERLLMSWRSSEQGKSLLLRGDQLAADGAPSIHSLVLFTNALKIRSRLFCSSSGEQITILNE